MNVAAFSIIDCYWSSRRGASGGTETIQMKLGFKMFGGMLKYGNCVSITSIDISLRPVHTPRVQNMKVQNNVGS